MVCLPFPNGRFIVLPTLPQLFEGPPEGSEWPVPGQELWQRRYASRPAKPQKRTVSLGGNGDLARTNCDLARKHVISPARKMIFVTRKNATAFNQKK